MVYKGQSGFFRVTGWPSAIKQHKNSLVIIKIEWGKIGQRSAGQHSSAVTDS
jgi:hypothetical protein